TKSIREEFNVDFLIAGTLTSMGPLLFFLAAMNMQVSYVSAIAASEPLITTVVSALIIKNTEKITPVTWVTVGMIFVVTTIIALYTAYRFASLSTICIFCLKTSLSWGVKAFGPFVRLPLFRASALTYRECNNISILS